jgi:WD40-like Beta Propeller Repeat
LRARNRVRAFIALAVASGVAAVVLAGTAVLQAAQQREAGDRAVRAARPDAQRILAGDEPFAVFRMLDRGHAATYGRIAVASVDGEKVGPAALAGPSCQRVAFAADHGLCLDVLGTDTSVEVLDSRMRVVRRFTLPGVPSRARISPDGRWGGVTTFVVGHAYASPGQFSTATTLVDLRAGRAAGNLERDFRVTHDGAVVNARDRNLWGLTFAPDGDTFYATMATGDRTFLLRGSIAARSAQTIHENVECPSISPDGTRIGYKAARSHKPSSWRFQVLDLATGQETALAEARSVDDQLAWLDDGHLLYGNDEQIWVVNADGSGQPRLWMDQADSPTVARPSSGVPAADETSTRAAEPSS